MLAATRSPTTRAGATASSGSATSSSSTTPSGGPRSVTTGASLLLPPSPLSLARADSFSLRLQQALAAQQLPRRRHRRARRRRGHPRACVHSPSSLEPLSLARGIQLTLLHLQTRSSRRLRSRPGCVTLLLSPLPSSSSAASLASTSGFRLALLLQHLTDTHKRSLHTGGTVLVRFWPLVVVWAAVAVPLAPSSPPEALAASQRPVLTLTTSQTQGKSLGLRG